MGIFYTAISDFRFGSYAAMKNSKAEIDVFYKFSNIKY